MMESEELQRRIHNGDRAAFGLLYDQYSRTVYSRALSSLDYASEPAKEVVKTVFITVYQDIRAASAPFDVAARIARLTDIEAAAILRRAAAQPVGPCPGAHAPQAPVYAQNARPADPPIATVEQAPPVKPAAPAEAEQKADAAQAESAPAPGVERESERQADKPRRSKTARARDIIVTVLICVLFVLFLWVLAGVFMGSGILPMLDLGYSFFNDAVYPLFQLGA